MEQFKLDHSLVGEARKFFNKTDPERQNLFLPVVDEKSRDEFLATQEMAGKLFKAKWDNLVDETLSSAVYRPRDIAYKYDEAEDYNKWM